MDNIINKSKIITFIYNYLIGKIKQNKNKY